MSSAHLLENEAVVNNSGIEGANGENQYLTFIMADEEYGVDILRVQEIRGWGPVTQIPNTPDYIKGVINIRGTIVPIVDLRQKFRMDVAEYGPMTVVIVVSVHAESKERVMGIVVDAVSDVYSIGEEALREAPDFGSVVDTRFVRGLATIDDKMLILLEIDRLLNADELHMDGQARHAE